MGPRGRVPARSGRRLTAFVDEMRSAITCPCANFTRSKEHINTPPSPKRVLQIFDRWVAAGIVPAGQATAAA